MVTIQHRGLEYEWLCDEQVVSITIHDFSRRTLNDWVKSNSLIKLNWPLNRAYFGLIYAPQPGLSLRLFLEKRATDVFGSFSGMHGREALVVPAPSIVPVMENAIAQLVRNQPNLQRRIFSTYEEAVAWLNVGLGLPEYADRLDQDRPHALRGRVLIVDDDANLLRLFSKVLISQGYDVFRATTLEQADLFLNDGHFDVLLCDVEVRDEYGIDLVRVHADRLMAHGTHVVVMSADTRHRAVSNLTGVTDFLAKPIEPSAFVEYVNRMMGT